MQAIGKPFSNAPTCLFFQLNKQQQNTTAIKPEENNCLRFIVNVMSLFFFFHVNISNFEI